MTALERFHRRHELYKRNVVKAKRRDLLWFRRGPEQQQRRLVQASPSPSPASPETKDSPPLQQQHDGPVAVDEYTVRIMQVEVRYCIQIHAKHGGTTTLGHVLAALRQSPQVLHALSGSLLLDNRNVWEVKERRYRVLYVWQAMASTVELARPISKWADFVQACRGYWEFPEPSSTATAMTIGKTFLQQLQQIPLPDTAKYLSKSRRLWQKLAATQSSTTDQAANKADAWLEKTWQQATQQRQARLASDAVKTSETRLQEHERETEAAQKARSLLRPLTADERALVHQAVRTAGNPAQVLAQVETDIVTRQNMQTLRPGQWLSDEVIHFFLAMLTKRDAEWCAADASGRRRRSHFFKSFFMTKLLNQGHTTRSGVYEYRNVKRWSKKVPGKDIFALDKIVFPINVNASHWVCAVAFMQDRKVQFYDSMGDDGMDFLQAIFQYLKDEHMDKKNTPLPNADEWQLVPCEDATPQQQNLVDCGVYTCMFADFVAKGCPLLFGQQHVNQCRDRIALAILQGKAIM